MSGIVVATPMLSNSATREFAENGIPDMLGEVSEETSEYYERFVNRVRYLTLKDEGVLPVYVKMKRVGMSYWKCGNCGYGGIREVHWKYCPNCGTFFTTRFTNYPNERKKEAE